MHEPDAILLAAFDDEPQSTPAAPAVRPPDRPRSYSYPSTHPSTDPIRLAVVDSYPGAEPQPKERAIRERGRLPFDIGLVDPQTAAFLVVFAAGTPLDALKPRTVSVPTAESASPVTMLALHARSPGASQPVPFLALQCPSDIRGRQLTLRFTDPTDLRSLVLAWNPIYGLASQVRSEGQ